ncbi:MAG: hypothetical protein HYX63_06155 [Gammaproteobacteria bacterium]|nr:hypothetical protein [Gammaproteobacteria bacterium]
MNTTGLTITQRRANRRAWKVVRTTLAADSTVSLVPSEQALDMMWQLAVDAWAMTGRPLPDYPRCQAPIRRVTLATDR